MITLESLSAKAKDWLESGAAEVLRDEHAEDIATVEDTERAVVGRRMRRR